MKHYDQMSRLALDALFTMTGLRKFNVILMDPPWKDTGVRHLNYPLLNS